MLTHGATGLANLDAHDDFLRARRGQIAARVLATGRHQPRTPRTLSQASALPQGAARLEVIALDAVVGTLEPTITFDARFRPASNMIRARWERIALAHRRGLPLPPIAVQRAPDGFYVSDGRHRVSVARALGHRDIEAYVTDTSPALFRPPLAA